MTRREHISMVAGAAAMPVAAAERQRWTAEWDRALIESAVASYDAAFDERESLIERKLGGEYRYHTNLRNAAVHPTRESLEYALMLLEAGGEARRGRALKIVERVAGLQDADPDSKWYGIWGYFLEEPPHKMSPADWNWADFNGATALMIEHRHGSKLPAPVRKAVHATIRHAAASVRRRNVAMSYTNIAVQGTFVTLAAAQLLDDKDLWAYSTARLQRLAGAIDQTGSFTEYNSPTYVHVTIANLTRIRMIVKDAAVAALCARIEERAWLHIARRWHAGTRQLAPPMSRSYGTDIGSPVWIQKATGGRVPFLTVDEIRSGAVRAAGETGILDYRCPEKLLSYFVSPRAPHQVRETFDGGSQGVRPVQGTTWIEPEYCLGSVNRANFWVQRRPLAAYWGGPSRPARYLQLRFLKDDYDFTSAQLYTAQEKNYVAGIVNFRSPGGDKHPSLDVVKDGQFTASRLRLRFDIAGARNARILADGRPIQPGGVRLGVRTALAVDLGGAKMWLQVRRAEFAASEPAVVVALEDGMLTLSLDLMRGAEPKLVRWSETPVAYAAFLLAMESGAQSLEDLHRRMSPLPAAEKIDGGVASATWATPAGTLGVTGSIKVADAAAQDRAFRETLNGEPAPLVRLSGERLL